MFDGKCKFAVLFIAMLLVLGLTLPACTCQKSTETEVPQASSEQQVDTEGTVAAVEQQDGTEETSAPPEQRVALSFEAAEYVNTDYGFSVKYLKEWLPQPIEDQTTVFYVAAAKRVPALSIYVLDGATFAEAVTAALSSSGSNIRIVTERATTLADGTPALEAVIKWKTEGFGVDTFALGVKKGEKWVIVAITTMFLQAKFDEAKFSEIAHTLEFK
ncbi:MAG: hypothetical protein H8E40_09905 [Chloroflexi bacterium]|nr:hypothetical protein [Chloroflexota bacterium]